MDTATETRPFVRKSQYSYDELLAYANRECGPDLPPLPKPPMLLFDRITEIAKTGGKHGKGIVRAELYIKPDLWFFPCHFEGDPVMPGMLQGDAILQLVGFFLGWLGAPGKGRAFRVGEMLFKREILPSAKRVEFVVSIKRAIPSGKVVFASGDGEVLCDGELASAVLGAAAIIVPR